MSPVSSDDDEIPAVRAPLSPIEESGPEPVDVMKEVKVDELVEGSEFFVSVSKKTMYRRLRLRGRCGRRPGVDFPNFEFADGVLTQVVYYALC
eukprot:6695226-Heterocapsa_arctica.AAC.2